MSCYYSNQTQANEEYYLKWQQINNLTVAETGRFLLVFSLSVNHFTKQIYLNALKSKKVSAQMIKTSPSNDYLWNFVQTSHLYASGLIKSEDLNLFQFIIRH